MSTVGSALGDLLFGQTRGGVLRLLFGHPGEKFYVRQIAREVGGSAGSVQRELETLALVGLISRSKLGMQVFYEANRDHPTYPEMRSLIQKTMGVFQLLEAALAPLAGRIALAFVYGSLARGEESAASDVDLMVVGDATLDEVLERLAPVERTIGRAVNPTLYSLSEFRTKLGAGNHFLTSVMRGEKMMLIGDADELGEVG